MLRGIFLTPLLLDSANEEPLFLESIWRPVPYDCKAVIFPRVPLMPGLPASNIFKGTRLKPLNAETRLAYAFAFAVTLLLFIVRKAALLATSRRRLFSLALALDSTRFLSLSARNASLCCALASAFACAFFLAATRSFVRKRLPLHLCLFNHFVLTRRVSHTCPYTSSKLVLCPVNAAAGDKRLSGSSPRRRPLTYASACFLHERQSHPRSSFVSNLFDEIFTLFFA